MSADVVNGDRLLVARGVLIAFGILLLGVAAVLMLREVNPTTYPGIAAWLAGAIVLHDGIAAMVVFGVAVLVRRVDGIPFAVRAIVQGAAAIGALVAVLVAPEIVKQTIGPANPSVLPLNYVGNLLLFEAALVAVSVVAVVITLVAGRRSTRRTAARTP